MTMQILKKKTRMHSGRMRTVRCRSRLWGGGYLPRGEVCLGECLPSEVSAQEVSAQGVSARHPPTLMKTLPGRNYA